MFAGLLFYGHAVVAALVTFLNQVLVQEGIIVGTGLNLSLSACGFHQLLDKLLFVHLAAGDQLFEN